MQTQGPDDFVSFTHLGQVVNDGMTRQSTIGGVLEHLVAPLIVLLIGWLAFELWRKGAPGRAMKAAVRRAWTDKPFCEAAARFVSQPTSLILPIHPETSCSEHQALFQRQLADHLSVEVSSDDVELVYRELIQYVVHNDVAALRSVIDKWVAERGSVDQASEPLAGDYSVDAYVAIGLLNDQHAGQNVPVDARSYFKNKYPGIVRMGHPNDLVRCGAGVETDRKTWTELVDTATQTVSKAYNNGARLHLIIGTKALWCYAFGAALTNRYHNLVLYHRQHPQYVRLWQVSRAVKNLRSPRAGRSANDLKLVEVRVSESYDQQAAGGREALILSFGSNDIELDVPRFLQRHSDLHNVPYRVALWRTDLDATESEKWVRVAAEAATLIRDSAARDIYLFADWPAALALMVGDSIGPYKGRVHLMQYVTGSDADYRDVFVVPDDLPGYGPDRVLEESLSTENPS
ncbi:MAG: hypothetical protein R3C59_03810 [Planctomycetaceae bacterium]